MSPPSTLRSTFFLARTQQALTVNQSRGASRAGFWGGSFLRGLHNARCWATLDLSGILQVGLAVHVEYGCGSCLCETSCDHVFSDCFLLRKGASWPNQSLRLDETQLRSSDPKEGRCQREKDRGKPRSNLEVWDTLASFEPMGSVLMRASN